MVMGHRQSGSAWWGGAERLGNVERLGQAERNGDWGGESIPSKEEVGCRLDADAGAGRNGGRATQDVCEFMDVGRVVRGMTGGHAASSGGGGG